MLPHAFRIGLASLATNPLRTFLSTLGVIIGTAALVAVIALGDGVEAYAREQIARQTDLQQFAVSSETGHRLDGIWLPRSDTVHLGPAELISLQQAVGPNVTLSLLRAGVTMVGGLRDDSLHGATVRANSEMPGDSSVALISPDLAALIDGDSVVGKVIQLANAPFTIIGVVGEPGKEDKLLVIQVPLDAYSRAVPAQLQRPAMIAGNAADLDDMPAAVEAARTWARQTGGDGLTVSNRNEMLVEVRKGMLMAKLMMGSITGISLLVGGIGIMNVLLAAVIERTREIGIRRASGARKTDVIAQFLAESVVITGAGSLIGLIVGVSGAFGLAALISSMSGAPLRAAFTAAPIIVSAASAVIIGLTFGIYPALRAARLSPIDAIRHE
jgi:putative ABC transport system permease protein